MRSLRHAAMPLMLRELIAVSPAGTTAFLATAVAAAAAPLGVAVALSQLVGAVPAAVAGGAGSPGGHRIESALVAISPGIYNGGDPTGLVRHIHWKARGKTSPFDTESATTSQQLTSRTVSRLLATVFAFRLARCGGHAAYLAIE
jgi:hypothetical protein